MAFNTAALAFEAKLMTSLNRSDSTRQGFFSTLKFNRTVWALQNRPQHGSDPNSNQTLTLGQAKVTRPCFSATLQTWNNQFVQLYTLYKHSVRFLDEIWSWFDGWSFQADTRRPLIQNSYTNYVLGVASTSPRILFQTYGPLCSQNG